MSFPCCLFQAARIVLTFQVVVFLLVVCLLLSLARLGRLDGFHRRPSSSRGGAKRTSVQPLLKPRSPDDGPCAGSLGYPFSNKKRKSPIDTFSLPSSMSDGEEM